MWGQRCVQVRSPARLSSRRVLQFEADTQPSKQSPARGSFLARASSDGLIPLSAGAATTAAALRSKRADGPVEPAVMINTAFMQMAPPPMPKTDMLQQPPPLKLNSTALASLPRSAAPKAASQPGLTPAAADPAGAALRPRRRTTRAPLLRNSSGSDALSEPGAERSTADTPTAARTRDAPPPGALLSAEPASTPAQPSKCVLRQLSCTSDLCHFIGFCMHSVRYMIPRLQ